MTKIKHVRFSSPGGIKTIFVGDASFIDQKCEQTTSVYIELHAVDQLQFSLSAS